MMPSRAVRPAARQRRSLTVAVLLAIGLAVSAAGQAADPADVLPVPPGPDDVEAAALEPVATAATAQEGARPVSFDHAPAASREPTGPLPLPAEPAAVNASAAAAKPIQPLGDWTVLLAIGGAFAALGIFRLRTLKHGRALPPDVFELLGTASLGGQQAVRVVRFGPRMLLIGVSSAGCQTLAELDDPQATERIAAACRSERLAARPALSRGATAARGPTAGGEAA